MIRNHLRDFFKQCLKRSRKFFTDIHCDSLHRFKDQWSAIQCSITCLSCLHCRPQYGLPCGNCVCENCVLMFDEHCAANPWIFKVQCCFLCKTKIQQKVIMKVHSSTVRIGILCVNDEGTCNIVSLKLMKQIEDWIQALMSLQTLLQKFCKLTFEISSGEFCSKIYELSTNLLRWFDHSQTLYQQLVCWKIHREFWEISTSYI